MNRFLHELFLVYQRIIHSGSKLNKLLAIACASFLLIILISYKPIVAQNIKVNLASSTNQSGFTTEIIKQLLEKLDYEVDSVSITNDSEFYISAATAKLDLWVDGIIPNHNSFFTNETISEELVIFDSLIKEESKNQLNCSETECQDTTISSSLIPVANKDFVAANPQIKKLLEIVEIPIEDIEYYNSLLGENSNELLKAKYAENWLNDNQGRVQLWIALARDEAVVSRRKQELNLEKSSKIEPEVPIETQDIVPQITFPQMKVVTKRFEPLVNYEEGKYVGFSIDFWDAIAKNLNINYELYGVDTVEKLLDRVKENQADIAIAGITITAERERVMDFSHPYYESGLQILVNENKASLSQTMWGKIFSVLTRPKLYGGVGIFILILLIAAHIIWLVEHKHNPEFPNNYAKGIWESFWWAAVTVTTVGYGDKTPRRLPGRMFGLFWMCAGYFIFAYFTATVTTSFTIQELQASIQGIQDLRGKEVATVVGTTADKYLTTENIEFIGYKTKEEAYLALKDGEIDAVVYDAPALKYFASHEGEGKVKIVGQLFEPQDYGIALPLNSPYRKNINSALLKLMEDGTYDKISNKWFGSEL